MVRSLRRYARLKDLTIAPQFRSAMTPRFSEEGQEMVMRRFLADLKHDENLEIKVRRALRLLGGFLESMSRKAIPVIDEEMEDPTLLSNIGLQKWADSVRNQLPAGVLLDSCSRRGETLLRTTQRCSGRPDEITLSVQVLWNGQEAKDVMLILAGDSMRVCACTILVNWFLLDENAKIIGEPMEINLAAAISFFAN